MRAALLALLAFPALCFGEHHRGHAIERLDRALDHLVGASAWSSAEWTLDNIDKWIVDTPARQRVFDTVDDPYHMAVNQIYEAKRLLESGGDLDEIRRLLNQPTHHPFWSSALSSLYRSTHEFRYVFVYHEGISRIPKAEWWEEWEVNRFSFAFYHISRAWQAVDEALWHVNDAIREEIYVDHEFICAGPGNHC